MRASDFPYFDSPAPIALAHRGGARYAPNVGRENTLAAFRTAYDLGYRYLETDVHATVDGHLVALHDTRLDRVSDRSGAIADLTWEQVRRARVGGEPVPLLSDLLEALPDARFNIDLKSPGAVVPAAQAILAAGALDRVCLGSFSQRRLSHARELLGPRVATAAGGPGVATLRFLPRLVSQWLRTPAPVLQILDATPSPGARSSSSHRTSWPPCTDAASRSTSGPSTTPPRCTSCSTSGSTAW